MPHQKNTKRPPQRRNPDFGTKREPAKTADFSCPPHDPIRNLLAAHDGLIASGNHYAYFELAYTRQTGWMAWLCTNAKELDPNRKVIASGQGSTPDEACENALRQLPDDPGQDYLTEGDHLNYEPCD